MNCSKCGSALALKYSNCPNCGAAVSTDVLGGQDAAWHNNRYRQIYSLWRVGILGLITFGLYYPYWVFATWKCMSTETYGRRHYPIWHAWAIGWVPFFNLFAARDHFETIKDLQSRSRVKSNISSPIVLWMLVLMYLLAMNSWDNVSYFLFLRPVLSTGMMIWGQANLNKYWVAVSRGWYWRRGNPDISLGSYIGHGGTNCPFISRNGDLFSQTMVVV